MESIWMKEGIAHPEYSYLFLVLRPPSVEVGTTQRRLIGWDYVGFVVLFPNDPGFALELLQAPGNQGVRQNPGCTTCAYIYLLPLADIRSKETNPAVILNGVLIPGGRP